MSKKRKWVIAFFIFFVVIAGYAWNEHREAKALHMMQAPEDILFEKELNGRLQKGPVNLREVVPGEWQDFCIVPPYGDIEKINANSELKGEINSIVNAGSRLFFIYNNFPSEWRWWLFTVKDGRVDRVIKGTGNFVVPALPGVNIPVCLGGDKKLKLKYEIPSSGSKRIIYAFEFI